MKKLILLLFTIHCSLFTVRSQVPVITTFFPQSDTVGATITIYGKNFSSTTDSNIVLFGTLRAEITEASAITLKAIVPKGVHADYLSVAVRGLTAVSYDMFVSKFDASREFDASCFMRGQKSSEENINNYIENIASVDIDGDGWMDIMVTSDKPYVILNNHGGLYPFKTHLSLPVDLMGGLSSVNMLIKDMNSDGKPDIIIYDKHVNKQKIYYLKNNSTPGNVSFDVSSVFEPGTNNTMAAGDLDGDGKPELVLVEDLGSGKSGIYVLKNTSTAEKISFAAGGTFGSYSDPIVGLDISILNGDSIPDILVVFDSKALCKINKSHPGQFQFFEDMFLWQYTYLGGPIKINKMKFIDVNYDGKKDLLVFCGWMLSYMNNSSPYQLIFQSRDTIPVGYSQYMTFDEITGDGKIDFVWPSSYTLLRFCPNFSTQNDIMFLNPKIYHTMDDYIEQDNNIYTAIYQQTTSGDYDRDGKVDIAAYNRADYDIKILWNQVKTKHTKAPVIESLSAYTGTTGDKIIIKGKNFDPVPTKNIVMFKNVRVYATAASTDSLTVTVPPGILFGPVSVITNGLLAKSKRYFSPWKGQKFSINSSTFSLQPQLSQQFKASSHELADMNNDKKTDLVVIGHRTKDDNDYIQVAYGKGLPNTIDFTYEIFPAYGEDVSYLHLTDLDNDAIIDITHSLELDNNKEISMCKNLSNEGSAYYDQKNWRFLFSNQLKTREVAFGDLDGDTKEDAVVVNEKSNTFTVFRNKCKGRFIWFAKPRIYLTGKGPADVDIADFNDDGKPDVVVMNNVDNTINIFENITKDTVIRFGEMHTLRANRMPLDIVVADMNGDDKPDIVMVSKDQYISVYVNNTTNNKISFSERCDAYIKEVYGLPLYVDVGDINGDQKPDIIFSDSRNDKNSLVIFENYSTPTQMKLGKYISYGQTSNNTSTVRVGDLDNDNIPDISIGVTTGAIHIFKNNGTGDAYNENNLNEVQDVTNILISTENAQALAVNELLITNYELRVYPNPVAERLTINYQLSTNSNLNIRIYDLMGREVKRIEYGELRMENRENNIIIDVRDFKNGIYFVKLSTNNDLRVVKFVKN